MTLPVPAPPPDRGARDSIELEWIDRIRADDEPAFEALFAAYVEPLCAFANSYVHSQFTAQELVQDLFCYLWARRHTLAVPRNVHAYLYGAIRNRAINHLRNRRVENAFLARTLRNETSRQAMPRVSTVDQEVEATVLAEAVERAIAEMPDRCREVFTLTRNQRLSYQEVATVLQLSPKTVEVHMGRALAFLRQKLAPWLRG